MSLNLGLGLTALRARRGAGAWTPAAGATAYRLKTSGVTSGAPMLESGIYDAGTFTKSSDVGPVALSRTSDAWNEVGAFSSAGDATVDGTVPIWGDGGSGLWIAPGATRLNWNWSAQRLVDAGILTASPDFSATLVTDGFAAGINSALCDVSVGTDTRGAWPPATAEPDHPADDAFMSLWVRTDETPADYAFSYFEDTEKLNKIVQVDNQWRRVNGYIAVTGNYAIRPYALNNRISGNVVTSAEVALNLVTAKTYEYLEILGPEGAECTVAPDDAPITLPAAGSSLLLDIAEYRGGDNDGCLVYASGDHLLTIDPETGEVVYYEGGVEVARSTGTVAAGDAAKIALTSDQTTTKIALNGTVEATVSSPCSLLTSTSVRLGNYEDGGATLHGSLARWIDPVWVDEVWDDTRLQGETV